MLFLLISVVLCVLLHVSAMALAGVALGSATVRMDVQPASLRHPFTASAVQRFSCP